MWLSSMYVQWCDQAKMQKVRGEETICPPLRLSFTYSSTSRGRLVWNYCNLLWSFWNRVEYISRPSKILTLENLDHLQTSRKLTKSMQNTYISFVNCHVCKRAHLQRFYNIRKNPCKISTCSLWKRLRKKKLCKIENIKCQ